MLVLRLAFVAALLLQQLNALVIPENSALHRDGSIERRAITRSKTQPKPPAGSKPINPSKVTKPKPKPKPAQTTSKSRTCPRGGQPPCACGQIGLRTNPKCPNEKIDFIDSKSNQMTKSTLSSKPVKADNLECDHKVELQFISSKMTADMCKHFIANPKDMTEFRSFLSTGDDKLVFVDKSVNNAKGKCFDPKVKLGNTPGKARVAAGVAGYVKAIKQDAIKVAGDIKTKMDQFAAQGGFQSFGSTFAQDYGKELDSVVKTANANAKRLQGLARKVPKPGPKVKIPKKTTAAKTAAGKKTTTGKTAAAKKKTTAGKKKI
ncbi:hypothetical protein V5O48_013460 [Marasmius crinis-equi]|uniref:Uncharacterized protein n=1 Tax=Marasmius crinis-equi TaxID=585013 RepID=A0ABR3F0E9_9AGAR